MSVEVAHGEGYVRLTLADPDRRNPLSLGMLAGLTEAVREYAADAGALVVTGAGGAFSGGADLRELTGTEADVAIDDAVEAAGAALREADSLVVAAVAGPCVGAAVDLVLNADVIVAERSAFFQVPATRLGLLYNPDTVARWHRRLPAPLLRRLLLAGERVEVKAARHAGLMADLVADGDAVNAAERIAAEHAGTPRAAFTATKRLLRELDDGTYETDRWAATRRRLLAAPERRAALDARTRRRTT